MIEFVSNIDPIAAWGATLSTVIAIREFLKSRTKIDISYNFTSEPTIGNEVFIRNLSEKPIIVTYWELLWCERKLFRWDESNSIDPEESVYDICIPPHSSKTLTFSGSNHFAWSYSSLKGRKIFLRLHLAGKKKTFFKKLYE